MRQRNANGGMPAEAITDEKRFVRGIHWKRTRYYLRARDKVHNSAWRILTIAGPTPEEEIKSIRSLMPIAHITSVDLYAANIAAARAAGANQTLVCDITPVKEVRKSSYSNWETPYWAPIRLLRDKRFDAICLDFTGPANDWLKQVVSCYARLLNPRGVMIVTFSYGRDVIEAVHEEWLHAGTIKYVSEYGAKETYATDYLKEIPETIAARVWYALRGLVRHLDSCLQYPGHAMPMVSCLLAKGKYPEAGFTAINPNDRRLALTSMNFDDPTVNLGDLFACPADEIEALRKTERRRAAARKAVTTRRHRQLVDQSLKSDQKFLTYFKQDDEDDEDDDGDEQQD